MTSVWCLVCVALVASLTGKWLHKVLLTVLLLFCVFQYPLVCHDIKSAMQYLLRLAPTMIFIWLVIFIACMGLSMASTGHVCFRVRAMHKQQSQRTEIKLMIWVKVKLGPCMSGFHIKEEQITGSPPPPTPQKYLNSHKFNTITILTKYSIYIYCWIRYFLALNMSRISWKSTNLL